MKFEFKFYLFPPKYMNYAFVHSSINSDIYFSYVSFVNSLSFVVHLSSYKFITRIFVSLISVMTNRNMKRMMIGICLFHILFDYLFLFKFVLMLLKCNLICFYALTPLDLHLLTDLDKRVNKLRIKIKNILHGVWWGPCEIVCFVFLIIRL